VTDFFDYNLLTIGHSNLQADQFLALLKAHNVTAIGDVRSVPFSRRFPWFSSRTLSERLHGKGIAYVMVGDTLGGRPANPALYCDGIADYEAMAATAEFRAGLDRVAAEMTHHRLCLMCSEREPLDCHRCLLVSRALAERGCTVGHILGDGSIESHAATEERLLASLRSVRRPLVAARRGLSPPCAQNRRPAVRSGAPGADAAGDVVLSGESGYLVDGATFRGNSRDRP
jgi:uncharacterized protein (DUF488 family)